MTKPNCPKWVGSMAFGYDDPCSLEEGHDGPCKPKVVQILSAADRVRRERERCAQACENMIAHRWHFDPDNKLSAEELLKLVADRIRKREFGPVVWDGFDGPRYPENDPDKSAGE